MTGQAEVPDVNALREVRQVPVDLGKRDQRGDFPPGKRLVASVSIDALQECLAVKGYSKENSYPVFQMLKDEGYRFGYDPNDGIPGWGKPYTGDAYGQDHIEARRVMHKTAEMIGAKIEQGASVG